MPSIPEFISTPSGMGIDLDKQNRQLEIERAVLLQKSEALMEKFEMINEHRKSEMSLFESFINIMRK